MKDKNPKIIKAIHIARRSQALLSELCVLGDIDSKVAFIE